MVVQTLNKFYLKTYVNFGKIITSLVQLCQEYKDLWMQFDQIFNENIGYEYIFIDYETAEN